MHYIGAGTEFPFARLASSLEESGDKKPTRAIITDSDFNSNFAKNRSAQGLLREAASLSQPLVLLLRNVNTDAAKRYRDLGATVVSITYLDDFPKMAAQLVTALFPDNRVPVES